MHGDICPVCLMGLDLLLLRGSLKNVTTSFDDATFTALKLKKYRIAFTTKGGVSWCLPPVNPITNSSRINSQNIATHYCYQLLLQIITKARNRIVLGFEEGTEKQMPNSKAQHFHPASGKIVHNYILKPLL